MEGKKLRETSSHTVKEIIHYEGRSKKKVITDTKTHLKLQPQAQGQLYSFGATSAAQAFKELAYMYRKKEHGDVTVHIA